MIAISHDMRFVAETFERVVVMRAGRVILDGTPAEVFAAESWDALRSTYLEPPLAAVVGRSDGARLDADRRPRCCRGARLSSSPAAAAAVAVGVEALVGPGRSSRCSRPSIGPGMGSAMTEDGTSSRRSVMPRRPSRRSAGAKRSLKSASRSSPNRSDECARLRSSMPRADCDGVDLVQAQLALEDVERPICLLPRRLAEMRGTVDEEARPVQRVAHADVAVEVGLGHAPNTTR